MVLPSVLSLKASGTTTGDYITRKLARGGHFSRSFAVTRASQLKRLILPTFKDRPLRAITRREIEAWQMKLYREKAIEPATINRCLDNMKVIMKEASAGGSSVRIPPRGWSAWPSIPIRAAF